MPHTPFAVSPAASPDALPSLSPDSPATGSPVGRSMAARLSGGLFLAAAGFQVALAAGAPWGAAAWGGANSGVLPMGYRVASVGSAAVLAGLGVALSGGVSAPRSRRRLLIGARICDAVGSDEPRLAIGHRARDLGAVRRCPDRHAPLGATRRGRRCPASRCLTGPAAAWLGPPLLGWARRRLTGLAAA